MTVFSAPAAPPELLTHLLDLIRGAAVNTPRSLQRAIGPSGVSMPCDRKLALTLLGVESTNTTSDKWPSSVGSAVHAWLADIFIADNEKLQKDGKPARWLVEQKVEVRSGLTGSCDLFDLATNSVVDHKVVGTTALKKYKREGPGKQYRGQIHLYGKAWKRMGLKVDRVAILFLPRAGMLPDAHLWEEPFDESIADEALARMDQLLVDMDIAEGAGMLDDYLRLVDRDTTYCAFCDFWSQTPVAPSRGCMGVAETSGGSN